MNHPHTSLDHARTFELASSQSWTAEKCCNLLRQLDTRLAVLRRSIASHEAHIVTTRRARCAPDEAEDRPSKRVRYTYGRSASNGFRTSNSARSATKTTADPAVGLVTPDLAPLELIDTPRTGQQPTSSGQRATTTKRGNPQEPDCAGPAFSDLLDGLRPLRNSIPNGRYRIYQANLEWLAGLLQSTQQQPRDAHPKSLLSMCLRRIPACVDNINAWEERDLTGPCISSFASDVSLQLYEQLEALGAAGRGWEPLRQTVRAHGIWQLEKAICEGLFSPDYVALLIRLCVRFNCVSEAARLTMATTATLPSPRSWASDFTENRNLVPLNTLLETTLASGYQDTDHVFGCVSRLLQEKLLPAEWALTKGFSRAILRPCLGILTKGRGGREIMDFLTTIIETVCRRNTSQLWDKMEHSHNAQGQTLIKIVARLTAGAIDSETSLSGGRNVPTRGNPVAKKALQVLDRSLNMTRENDELAMASDSILFVLGRYLVSSRNDDLPQRILRRQTENDMAALLAKADKHAEKTTYLKALLLICTISQKIGYSQGKAAKDVFSNQCRKLDVLGLPPWFLDNLRKDGPFLVGQRDADLHGLVFTTNGYPTTSLRNVASADWRWEESISEWVPPTPRIAADKSLSFTRGSTRCHILSRTDDDTVARSVPQIGSPVHVTITGTESLKPARLDIRKDMEGSTECGSACVGQGKSGRHVTDPVAASESLAACPKLDTAQQKHHLGTKPTLETRRLKFYGKENQVHADSDFLSKRTAYDRSDVNSGLSTNSGQQRQGRPCNIKRKSKGGRLLIVGSGNSHDSTKRCKQRKVGSMIGPAGSLLFDLEADWEDVF